VGLRGSNFSFRPKRALPLPVPRAVSRAVAKTKLAVAAFGDPHAKQLTARGHSY
jgi:hypothetical protein